MFTLAISLYIANAAARFSGRHGAVIQQAQDQGCSRQTVYNHASEVVEAIDLPTRHVGITRRSARQSRRTFHGAMNGGRTNMVGFSLQRLSYCSPSS
jgi:hypothetical protein